MLPTPYLLDPARVRVLVAFLDEHGIGRIGSVDLAASNPEKVLGVSEKPLLDIGRDGAFDDNGVVPGALVINGETQYLYYTGFQIGVRVPYFLFCGLAVSTDEGKSFQRCQDTPVLERSPRELFFRAAPFVIKEGSVWRMWYIAGSGWLWLKGKLRPVYHVSYCESGDGLSWPKSGRTLFVPSAEEHGFGRPYFARLGDSMVLFYSIRKRETGYRLGLAYSEDGIQWSREDDEMALVGEPGEWESENCSYAAVIPIGDRFFMFYNGNHFGRTGFGLAELEA